MTTSVSANADLTTHNVEAEACVLGAVLVDGVPAYSTASTIIRPSDFFRKAHQDIFAASGALVDRGSVIDLVTIKDELATQGRLADIGGPYYLSELVSGIPRSMNVEYHARIIKEKAIRRECTESLDDLLKHARSGNVTLHDIALRVAKIAQDTEEHVGAMTPGAFGLPHDALRDAVDVAAEGRTIAVDGVPYVLDGVIPAYGGLGFMVAYAKVGKTTFGHALGAAVAMGQPFLDRAVLQTRVLMIAAEDPPEYTAYLARHLNVTTGQMTFYRRPVRFDDAGLRTIAGTVRKGGYGLVIVSSWQAVTVGLIRDENDNAGAVSVVERTKQTARDTGIPWVIDAHSGKGEDQADEADPTRAMRGASAAAGAADYMLSLRYADGPFSSRRRLSGKGRFVSLEPMLLDYDIKAGVFTTLGDGKSATAETTWHLIRESGALRDWGSVDAIAIACGLATTRSRVSGSVRRKVRDALNGRAGVDIDSTTRRGQKTTLYRETEAV